MKWSAVLKQVYDTYNVIDECESKWCGMCFTFFSVFSSCCCYRLFSIYFTLFSFVHIWSDAFQVLWTYKRLLYRHSRLICLTHQIRYDDFDWSPCEKQCKNNVHKTGIVVYVMCMLYDMIAIYSNRIFQMDVDQHVWN